MRGTEIRSLRECLRLSRADLARFLGVSEATIVRWESADALSEPRGLQMLLLRAIAGAQNHQLPQDVARVVRSCTLNHGLAIQKLLEASQ